MSNSTTKQEKSLKNGNPINKDTQFGGPKANPRHNGAWKKEDTARYKLEQMMKLSPSEIDEIITNQERPLFEIKLAQAIKSGRWKEVESMINQVYGSPKETKDLTVSMPKPILGGITDGED